MKKIVRWFFHPPVTGPATILLIRFLAAGPLISTGIQDFCYASLIAKTAFHHSAIFSHIVPVIEIIVGLFLLLGLFTRIISFFSMIQMIIVLWKWKSGTWAVHDGYLYYAQIFIFSYLIIEGPGKRSLDFAISASRKIYCVGDYYMTIIR